MKRTTQRIALLITLLMCALTAGAQQLEYKELVNLFETAGDYSASRYSRADLNGRTCALIKVQLPIEGCLIEGDVVGDVEFRVTEYWVYVPENTKRLIIRCPRMETSIVVWQPQPGNNGVRSGVTYSLRLSGYEHLTSQPVAPARESNYLVLTLSPANASVRIDGQQQPPATDGKLMTLLKRGTHRVEVSAYGYADKTVSITMAEERQNLSVELTSVMATLTVSCATSEATIYVNDVHQGTGRWTGTLAAGTYRIEARLDGYRSAGRDIVLGENDQQTIDIPALTAIRGQLDVSFQPIGAEVWVDNKRATASPDVFNLLVGTHMVEIRATGYTTHKATVAVTEGKTTHLSGSLTKATGATGSYKNHDYVDLGLSVMWATCNMGAGSPDEYGDYYAWGETAIKSNYTEKNSKTYRNKAYNRNIGGDASADAARANWSGTWRLPTEAEFQELLDKCTWIWTTQGGTKGYKVTSKENGASIFLPAAGYRSGKSIDYAGEYGSYWSSSPTIDNAYSAQYLYFSSTNHITDWRSRYHGRPIRPVAEL